MSFLRRWFVERWRGLALFALIWLVVLCVPPLRLLLRVQILGSSLSNYEINPVPFNFYPDDFSSESLLADRPQDLRAQVFSIEYDKNQSGFTLPTAPPTSGTNAEPHYWELEGQASRYDKLLRQYPKKSWLIALHLRCNLERMAENRIDQDSIGQGKLKHLGTFAPQQMAHVITLARQGQRLEPNNAFFDWVLCCFMLANSQDTAAYAALSAASHKSVYDDHTLDLVQNNIALCESVRPLTLQERIGLSAYAGASESGVQFQTRVNLLALLMQRTEKKGHTAQALVVRSDMARLFNLMMHGRTSFNMSVMSDLQVSAWSDASNRAISGKLQQSLKPGAPSYPIQRILLAARMFATYARKQGRSDVADETLRLGKRSASLIRVEASPAVDPNNLHLPARLTTQIKALTFMGAFALLQIASLMIICTSLSIILLFTRPQLEPRDITFSTLITGTAAIAFSFSAVPAITRLNMPDYGRSLPPGAEDVSAAIFCVWIILPFLVPAFVSWGAALPRIWKRQREIAALPRRFDDASAQYFSPPDHLPLAITLCTAVNVTVAIACWILAITAWLTNSKLWTLPFKLSPTAPPQTISDPISTFFACAMLLSAAIFAGWIVKWRWFAPTDLRPISHGALRRYRQTLSLLIITYSLFYLFFSTLSLGPHREANYWFNEYLNHGKIALLQLK